MATDHHPADQTQAQAGAREMSGEIYHIAAEAYLDALGRSLDEYTQDPAQDAAFRAAVDAVRDRTEQRIAAWLWAAVDKYDAIGYATLPLAQAADAIGRGEHRQDGNTLHECSEEGNAFGGYNCTCGQPWLDTLGCCQADPNRRGEHRQDSAT